MAAFAASRARKSPAAVFLLSPEAHEDDIAPASVFARPGLPLLIIATRSAPGAAEAHLDLYIGARPDSELWTLGGGGRGVALLGSRTHLMVDLADWVCGKLAAAAHGLSGPDTAAPADKGTGSR